MDNSRERKEYIIPRNVRTKFEFFSGFGWKELFVTALGIIVGALLFLLIGLFTNSNFRIIPIPFFGAIGFLLSYSNPRVGRSTLTLFKDLQDFNKGEKRYYYKFGEGRDKSV